MTVSKPCYFGNMLLGIVGVDVNLAYILEDVTYYRDSSASYTFLIDNKGEMIVTLQVNVILTAQEQSFHLSHFKLTEFHRAKVQADNRPTQTRRGHERSF